MTRFSHGFLAVTALLMQSLLVPYSSFASGEIPGPTDSMKTVEMDSIVIMGVKRPDPGFSFSTSSDELRSIPTASTDPTRALILLPASVPVSDIKSMPTIGGEEPDRMLILLDGVPLSLPVRLLGTFSVFNPLVTQSIDMTESGFSVSQGNAFPAGIQVRTREHYEAPVVRGAFDLTSSTVALGLPLSKQSDECLTTALRMSHIHAVSPFLSSSGRERLGQFTPQLRDAYLDVNLMPSKAWSVRLQTLATSENGSVSSKEKSFGYTWRKTFINTQASTVLGRSVITTGVSWSRDALDLSSDVPIEDVGSFQFSTTGSFNIGRAVLTVESPLSEKSTLSAGSDLTIIASMLSFGSSSGWLSRQSPLRQYFANSALYAEVTIADILSRVKITSGLRASYFGLMENVGVEPRVEIGTDLGNAMRLTLRYGRYLVATSNLQVLEGFLSFLSAPDQPPRMLVTRSGHPAVPEESNAWSASLGREFPAGKGVDVMISLDGYAKIESHLLQSVRYPAVFTVLDSNSFEPSQRFSGRKHGVGGQMGISLKNLSLKINGSAYWQHSSTTDGRTDATYPNGGDIPMSIKMFIGYEPGSVKIIATFQHYSGAPTTGRSFLKGTNLMGGEFFFPLDGELNSSRLPDYNRVDLAASYRFSLAEWQVEPYVQVLNLMDSRNVSSYDYSLSSGLENNVRTAPEYNTLPVLPLVGVRVERTW